MNSNQTDNPLHHSAAHEPRIRERAYCLWQQDVCLAGHDAEYCERAAARIARAGEAGQGRRKGLTLACGSFTHPALA
jgi:hypothetical protein